MQYYVFLEDKEQLLNTLEKCYEERTWPMYLLKVESGLDFVRPEPRFKALLKKVGLDI